MTRFQPLNNVEHKDLKIITERSARYGDDVWYVPTFPTEFRQVQRHYPIFFVRHSKTGEVMAVALLGLEKGENLFLTDEGWDASYIPLNILRQPLLVGYQEQQDYGETVREPVVSVDMDSPRVSEQEGESLFLEHGGNSDYLEHMSGMLKLLLEGSHRAKAFYELLDEYGLLESFVLDAQLDDGSEHRLSGFHAIREEGVRKLNAEQLKDLNDRGYLEAIYMAIASQSHLADLMERKNWNLRLGTVSQDDELVSDATG
ncbi:MAG: SapC family protein [Pseudomonadota bacterium]